MLFEPYACHVRPAAALQHIYIYIYININKTGAKRNAKYDDY